jgi:hypothetical protein
MTLGSRFLRFVAPQNESMRMEMRHSMAVIEAHTEDMTRTVTLNRDQLLAAIERFRSLDPDKTAPGLNGH